MAAAVLMINPHGEEVRVTHRVIERLKAMNVFDQFHRQVFRHQGTGDPKRLCLLLNQNGIGDDLHAMPAIYQKIQDGYRIEIGGLDDPRHYRMFNAPFYESIGCEILLGVKQEFIDANIDKYGAIYSMKMWCLEHDFDSEGTIQLTRFEQFARYLEVDLPATFSWKDRMMPEEPEPRRDTVVLALTSTSVRRSYAEQLSLLNIFRKKISDVRILGGVHKGGKCDFLQELIDLIYHAKLVVAVDNGILALALALGTPVVAIFGPTDENCIIKQFDRYLTPSYHIVRTEQKHECSMPCSFQPQRGHGQNGKCKPETFSDCLQDLTPQMIFNNALSFLN